MDQLRTGFEHDHVVYRTSMTTRLAGDSRDLLKRRAHDIGDTYERGILDGGGRRAS